MVLRSGNTVKPRFWNTFATKILFINRFFAADLNFLILHRSPRFWNTFAGISKSGFYCSILISIILKHQIKKECNQIRLGFIQLLSLALKKTLLWTP